MQFDIVRLAFPLEGRRSFPDIYRWFSLRSRFESELRHALCTCGPPCAGTCSASTLLDRHLAADPAAVKRYQKPPLPFVFNVPAAAGEPLELTLFGSAINEMPAFVHAVEAVLDGSDGFPSPSGKPMAYDEADGIWRAQAEGEWSPPVINLLDLLQSPGSSRGSLRIRFTSPLRLFRAGKPVARFDFPLFVGSILRRVSSLAYYYGGIELDADFSEVTGAARRAAVTDAVRAGGVKQGDLSGSVAVTGDIDLLAPWLHLAPLIHSGKGAAYGFGACAIE